MNISKNPLIRISVQIIFWLLAPVHMALAAHLASPKLVLDQVGYLPNWPKIVMIVGESIDNKMAEVINAETRKVVYQATISPARPDPQTGDILRTFDFSDLKSSGRYFVRFGLIESYQFEIGEAVFREPINKLLRSYYLQRCGVAINDKITGIKHAACHVEDGVIAHDDAINQAGVTIAASGGWHDAGDYGKYVATTATAVGRLLSLFEQAPGLFSDNQLNIPESGNGIPDLLDEMKIGLDWMLTMQRSDGAVYRKLSGKAWPHLMQPQDDVQTRYLYGISTPETAKAVAAWAMAARIYKRYLPSEAKKYLDASIKGWHFLDTMPEQVFDFHEGDNTGSGPYMQNKTDTEEALSYDWDDRLWAAIELYITTGDRQWIDFAIPRMTAAPLRIFEWKNPSELAFEDFLFHTEIADNQNLRNEIKQKIIARADTILETVAYSGYHIANSKFIWSSNKMTAEEGIFFLQAYRLTGNTRYMNAAIDQIDYLLGRNHFNMTFASDIGSNPVAHVSHIFAQSANVNIPGLFVGGPNTLEQSGIGPKFKGPLSYIDDVRSYATNEYAIDYNASFITLLAQAISIGLQ